MTSCYSVRSHNVVVLVAAKLIYTDSSFRKNDNIHGCVGPMKLVLASLSNPALVLKWESESSVFSFGSLTPFGMHMHWLLTVKQRHVNPFTRNPAKLPCRQALHFKCTISYPCLVWMQHFWNIKPRGNTGRMTAAKPRRRTSSILLPTRRLLFLFCLFSLSISFIFPDEQGRHRKVHLQLYLCGGFFPPPLQNVFWQARKHPSIQSGLSESTG